MRKGIISFWLGFFTFQLTCVGLSAGTHVRTECYAQEEKADPVDPLEWDFGQLKQGEIVKHDFVFKNETADILEINSIHTSCGCTASEAGKKTLLPQESTTIKVTFNSRGYSGAVTQFVYVNTDNADLAIIKFTIKANVVKG